MSVSNNVKYVTFHPSSLRNMWWSRPCKPDTTSALQTYTKVKKSKLKNIYFIQNKIKK
jgi:hypothetical protein